MHIYSRGSFEDSVLYGTFGWRSLFPTGWWQKPPLVPGRLGLLKEQFRTWQLLPSGWAREGQNLISGVTFHCCHILFVRSSYKSSSRSIEEGDCTGVTTILVYLLSVFFPMGGGVHSKIVTSMHIPSHMQGDTETLPLSNFFSFLWICMGLGLCSELLGDLQGQVENKIQLLPGFFSFEMLALPFSHYNLRKPKWTFMDIPNGETRMERNQDS